MNSELLGAIAIGAIVQCIILYFVIKGAVSGAVQKNSEEILKQIKLSNQLKFRELHKAGVSKEELQSDIDKVYK